MNDQNSVVRLLHEVGKGNGYVLYINGIKVLPGTVRIFMSRPERTVIITEEVYKKIKEYLVVTESISYSPKRKR